MDMDAYAAAGVDYAKIEPFKRMMQDVARRTAVFPQKRRNIRVFENGSYRYADHSASVRWHTVLEGLGSKGWIAEWMYRETGDPGFFSGIGIDTAMMAVVDVLRTGALPAILLDEITAGSSAWFSDEVRAEAIAESFFEACEIAGMALVGGESASLRYHVRTGLRSLDAPVFSSSVTGVIAPNRVGFGSAVRAGHVIIGVASSGLHANGASLLIRMANDLPRHFLETLPSGRGFGEVALTPTCSYVALLEELAALGGLGLSAALPVTGGGVSKPLRFPKPFTYRITAWPTVPEIFRFVRERGVPLATCLRTFNWGVGLMMFMPEDAVARTLDIGRMLGYGIGIIGRVEQGPAQVIFEPERITLTP